jgi:hypothetical protein
VNVEELRACLDSALISGCKHLVGDLRDLRFIDVRGARCFVGVQAG